MKRALCLFVLALFSSAYVIGCHAEVGTNDTDGARHTRVEKQTTVSDDGSRTTKIETHTNP